MSFKRTGIFFVTFGKQHNCRQQQWNQVVLFRSKKFSRILDSIFPSGRTDRRTDVYFSMPNENRALNKENLADTNLMSFCIIQWKYSECFQAHVLSISHQKDTFFTIRFVLHFLHEIFDFPTRELVMRGFFLLLFWLVLFPACIIYSMILCRDSAWYTRDRLLDFLLFSRDMDFSFTS